MTIFGFFIPMWLGIPFVAIVALSILNVMMWIMAPIIGIKILFKIVKLLFRIIKILLPIAIVVVVFYLICSYTGGSVPSV